MGEHECFFNKDQLNFFRVCHLATNVLPHELRAIFIQQWNLLFSSQHGHWCNTPKNGQDFLSMESNSNKKRNKELLNTMQNGDTEQWDCTMLFYGLLYSSSVGGSLETEIRRLVNSLREFRNQSFAHVSNGEVTSSDFQMILNKLLQALLGLRRDTSLVKRVQNLNSFSTDEVYELQEKLEFEKKTQLDFDKRICNLEDKVLNLENKMLPPDNDEECYYSNLSFNQDNCIAPFVILPGKPNHPIIERSEVEETIKILNDLRTMHHHKISSVILIGKPLSGKTDCARSIGQALSKHKSVVAAVQCDSFQNFVSSLLQLAEGLGYNQSNFPSLRKASVASQTEILALFIKEKISRLTPWVIVLDHVLKETKELMAYLPQPGDEGVGQIIVTTQDCCLASDNPYTVPVVLNKLTSTESLQLLSLLVGNIPQDVARFVSEKLDFEPALLVSAAKRVTQVSAKRKKAVADTWMEMLENVKSQYKEEEWPYYIAAMNETTRSRLESVVKTVIKRSNVIEECCHLLVLASRCLLPLNVVARFLANELDITEREAEFSIRDSSLTQVCTNDNITVSGVIYKLLSDVFAPTIRTEQMIRRLRRLCQFCVLNVHDTSITKVFKVMSPKVMQYVDLLDLCFREYEEQRSLHHELGKAFLCVLVDFSSAVRCFTKAISIFERCNDISHPEYAQLLNSLGNVLRLTGSMKDACKYLSKSLKILKAIAVGNGNEDIASCLSSLGLVCLSQGDLDRAIELHYRALTMREQLHGNEHITTATSLNNIGAVYHERGDLATAKTYYWKALEIKGRNYGWDFPHVANSFNNIAEISHEQGDLCGAISIHKRALKIRQRLFGDDHPDVADSLNNIGVIYHKLGELSAARKYHTKALGIRKKVHGEDHLEVARSQNKLGEVFYDEGDLAAAEDCHIQALRIRHRHFATSCHPEVITSLHNLKMVYIADQKFSIATEYAYEVFQVCQKIHGIRDTRTVEAFRKLTELSKRESQGRSFDFSLAVHEHVERLSCL